MNKQSHFVFLPTDKASNICLMGDKAVYDAIPYTIPEYKKQHIYVTSDDEPKEGDWVCDFVIDNKGNNQPTIYRKRRGVEFQDTTTEKKIIATTNPELTDKWKRNKDGEQIFPQIQIQSISQSDIEHCISLYNGKGKGVDVEAKANKWALDNADETMGTNSALNKGYKGGYNQCLQDNADKFTLEKIEEAMQDALREGMNHEMDFEHRKKYVKRYIESLAKEQPKSNTVMVEYELLYENQNLQEPLYTPKIKDGNICIVR